MRLLSLTGHTCECHSLWPLPDECQGAGDGVFKRLAAVCRWGVSIRMCLHHGSSVFTRLCVDLGGLRARLMEIIVRGCRGPFQYPLTTTSPSPLGASLTCIPDQPYRRGICHLPPTYLIEVGWSLFWPFSLIKNVEGVSKCDTVQSTIKN